MTLAFLRRLSCADAFRHGARTLGLAGLLLLGACRLETTVRVPSADVADAARGQPIETTAELVIWAPLTADRAPEQAAELQRSLARFIPGLRYVRFQEQRSAIENGLVFEFPLQIGRDVRFSTATSPLFVQVGEGEGQAWTLALRADAPRIAEARRVLAQRNPMMRLDDRDFSFKLVVENSQREPLTFAAGAVFLEGRALDGDRVQVAGRRSVTAELSNHAAQRLMTPGLATAPVGSFTPR